LYNEQEDYDFVNSKYVTVILLNAWSSLPDYVVDVDIVNLFKVRLGKVVPPSSLFDYQAEISGSGDRSLFLVNTIRMMWTQMCLAS